MGFSWNPIIHSLSDLVTGVVSGKYAGKNSGSESVDPIAVTSQLKAKKARGEALTYAESEYLRKQSLSSGSGSSDYNGGAGSNGLLGPSISESNTVANRAAGNDSIYNQQVPQQAGGNSNSASMAGMPYDPNSQIGSNATGPWDQALNLNDISSRHLPTMAIATAPTGRVSPKDFTDQANTMAGKAYAPIYQSLDTGRANSKTQYTLADKVVAGLYAKLAEGNTADQAATTAQYAKTGADQKTAAADTQSAIGAGYQAGQSAEAKTLAALGIQSAAPGAMNLGTNSQGFQQGQAQINSDAQAANLQAQGASQNDYQKNMGSADKSTGLAAQSSLVDQLGSTLSQYDAQQENVAGQQASQALTIGQGLTTADMNAQQTNLSAAQQEYQNQVAANTAAYNQQVADMQYGDQQVAGQAAAQQQQLDNQLNQTKILGGLGIDQQNADTTRITADANAGKTAWDVDPKNPANAPKDTTGQKSPDYVILQGLGNTPAVATAISRVKAIMLQTNTTANSSKAALMAAAVLNTRNGGGTDADASTAQQVAALYADSIGLK